ncbi:MAG: hypothetical protein QG610_2074 [Euryarchaeota archaeon]|nr:hypothetical protein [Euryarchaeota archaeon]
MTYNSNFSNVIDNSKTSNITDDSNSPRYKHLMFLKDLFDKLVLPSTGGVILWLVIIFFCGLGDIVIFALQSDRDSQFRSIIGAGFLAAGAFFISGILIGFIFGIPRIMSHESLQSGSRKGSLNSGIYGENSNLDQISDWLSKILVAIGLTQLTQIPQALGVYANKVGPAFGDFPSSYMFSIATLIFFSLDGFLIGYLWTRRSAAQEFHKSFDELEDSVAAQKGTDCTA